MTSKLNKLWTFFKNGHNFYYNDVFVKCLKGLTWKLSGLLFILFSLYSYCTVFVFETFRARLIYFSNLKALQTNWTQKCFMISIFNTGCFEDTIVELYAAISNIYTSEKKEASEAKRVLPDNFRFLSVVVFNLRSCRTRICGYIWSDKIWSSALALLPIFSQVACLPTCLLASKAFLTSLLANKAIKCYISFLSRVASSYKKL